MSSQESGKSARKTLRHMLDTIQSTITDKDCETLDFRVILPCGPIQFEVCVTPTGVDLYDLSQNPTHFSKLPSGLKQQNLRVPVPFHVLVETWYETTMFQLCQSIAGVLESIMELKAGCLIQSNIIACKHLTVPFKIKRCRRLDQGLRSEIAKMSPKEYKRFEMRLKRKGQPQATVHSPCHKSTSKRHDTKHVQVYLSLLQKQFKESREKNIWLTTDAGNVGLESNLCSAAVLGYDGPSCWMAPQARLVSNCSWSS